MVLLFHVLWLEPLVQGLQLEARPELEYPG